SGRLLAGREVDFADPDGDLDAGAFVGVERVVLDDERRIRLDRVAAAVYELDAGDRIRERLDGVAGFERHVFGGRLELGLVGPLDSDLPFDLNEPRTFPAALVRVIQWPSGRLIQTVAAAEQRRDRDDRNCEEINCLL